MGRCFRKLDEDGAPPPVCRGLRAKEPRLPLGQDPPIHRSSQSVEAVAILHSIEVGYMMTTPSADSHLCTSSTSAKTMGMSVVCLHTNYTVEAAITIFVAKYEVSGSRSKADHDWPGGGSRSRIRIVGGNRRSTKCPVGERVMRRRLPVDDGAGKLAQPIRSIGLFAPEN